MTGRSPTVSLTPFSTCLLNPGAVTSTWYGPGTRLGAVYSPARLVVTTRLTSCSRFFSVTVAPCTTLPWGSVTVPSSVAPTTCARRAGVDERSRQSKNAMNAIHVLVRVILMGRASPKRTGLYCSAVRIPFCVQCRTHRDETIINIYLGEDECCRRTAIYVTHYT